MPVPSSRHPARSAPPGHRREPKTAPGLPQALPGRTIADHHAHAGLNLILGRPGKIDAKAQAQPRTIAAGAAADADRDRAAALAGRERLAIDAEHRDLRAAWTPRLCFGIAEPRQLLRHGRGVSAKFDAGAILARRRLDPDRAAAQHRRVGQVKAGDFDRSDRSGAALQQRAGQHSGGQQCDRLHGIISVGRISPSTSRICALFGAVASVRRRHRQPKQAQSRASDRRLILSDGGNHRTMLRQDGSRSRRRSTCRRHRAWRSAHGLPTRPCRSPDP